MKGRYLLIVLTVVLLVGCHKRPFNLFSSSDNQDTLSLEEIYALQRKALEAENAVMAVVKSDSSHRWVQHEHGWWYCYTSMSEDHFDEMNYLLKKDTCQLIHETVYDLSGKFILDAIREYEPVVGEPFSYRFMLREMVPGDTVLLLAPWTMAYGSTGNAFIRPYTNIRAQLTMHISPFADIELAEDSIANKGL